MSRYATGAALEREIIALFRAAGWEHIRGAGSKGEALGCKADMIFSRFTDSTKRTAYLVIAQAKLLKRG
jgi:Holliday junction resolvase